MHLTVNLYKTRYRCLTDSNRRPKGLLIDLDGTVLPRGNKPTEAVLNAIKAASEIIPVSIASGRVQDDVSHFARMFAMHTPQVADNGATLIDPITGRMIKRYTMGRVEAEETLHILKSSSVRLIICDDGRFLLNADDITAWEITMIAAQFPTEEEARKWAALLNGNSITAKPSLDNRGDWYIDCTKAGVDKGTGAENFVHEIGIKLADLMVIGDGWNDVPMFEVAGISIAMDGAPYELLDIATGVVPDIDSNGAVDAIEQYVLSRSL